MVPLIIDRTITTAGGGSASLLAVPLGARSLLEHIVSWLAAESSRAPLVLPARPVQEESTGVLASCCRQAGAQMITAALPAALAEFEAEERLLLVDAGRVLPLDVGVARLCARLCGWRGVAHFVAVGCDRLGGARERVQCDDQGRVTRVDRLLDAACWPAVADRRVLLSVVPVAALDGPQVLAVLDPAAADRAAPGAQDKPCDEGHGSRLPAFLRPADPRRGLLDLLRQELTRSGVLTRDEPVEHELPELTRPAGLLALGERLMRKDLDNGVRRRFVVLAKDVLAGPECRIDPAARLVGPLILHECVRIERGAAIIGPAVLGAGSRVGGGATVAQSVLLPGADIAGGRVLRREIAAGEVSAAPPEEPAGAVAEPDLSTPANGSRTDGWPVRSSRWGETSSSRQPRPGHRRRLNEMLKRGLDVLGAAAGLILLAPLLLLVALLIKLESAGPVLFVHRRESRGGREFPCYKFRTMQAGAHARQRELRRRSEVDGPQFKITHDPRVTRLGRLLRASNIDELPQLINVLAGHMSLVGPRPSPLRENRICIPWRRARLSVRPGLTGLWQVCRSVDRSQGDFHEWIYYDITYVRHFSFWLDLKILAATAATLGGRWSIPASWLLGSRAARPAPAGAANGAPAGGSTGAAAARQT
jgi:lipopolysaccharide/colanic/teichoic acid biosynthesis glycosyltransferase/alkylhydroperoxidase/carboxymuconolactone decarboxylase family protein YurZ